MKRTYSMSKSLNIKRTWNAARPGNILFLLVAAFFFASCSESDDTISEFDNWKQKNDTYWASLYTQTKQRIASGDTSWKILPKWSLSNQSPMNAGTVITNDSTDCIIVHVEKEGDGARTPNYTDTVQVHYLGRLIPSPTYTSGYIFDASYDYSEGYNLQIMRPYTTTCGNFISWLHHCIAEHARGRQVAGLHPLQSRLWQFYSGIEYHNEQWRYHLDVFQFVNSRHPAVFQPDI